ncbi:flagellar motor switch protein FliG [Oharaeibacter diazotrophicus]|uniref:Flagellar motor switch protein FliG n=1 Tax=Oharaeibacter diazotrophicus TaxID=1920512 RepID=A0A4R6R9J1_9HYPH|nr:flagellar motor switch protein FliG [Oharaeibacter diazotrophicus]TDP82723.1 flagellar motor switch protein FliG [Oharaeibacter diazotrophicus]BBE72515.1 flagellar motor switch protein FliG [Pleomorphomonas sp. SM30]GLS76546.1 flagellar motor switch protein FliG [Oharaeibacter diazotrophicus]
MAVNGPLSATAIVANGNTLTISSASEQRALTGGEKAAVMMLALGDKYGSPIWKELDEIEIKQLSQAMSKLGPITPTMLDDLMVEFVTKVSSTGALMGNYDTTERLLLAVLPQDKVNAIMEEIRGPAGRNMWEKLSNVQEVVLANYLKNEYPQTVAVVLSKIKADHAARVLAKLPEEFALEVVNRMLKMESVQKDVLDKVEQTLRVEFMSNLTNTQRRDAHEMMAEIFNNFDRTTEARFVTALEENNREAADRIKALMFTFDDLGKLDPGAIQTLLRNVEKDKLALALKGAKDQVKDLFFGNMSARASAMLKEDMEALGPVRLRDVDEAQVYMINTAKDLAAKGEIMISKNKGEDDLVV